MDHSDPKQVTTWLVRALAYVVYAYLLITEFVLIQGFLLKLFGANTGSSYVDWAYRSLDRSMTPFRGIFESIELGDNSVLDTSILFAMVIYGILALVVSSFLQWLTYRLERMEHETLAEEARARLEADEAYRTGYDAARAAHAAGETDPPAMPPVS